VKTKKGGTEAQTISIGLVLLAALQVFSSCFKQNQKQYLAPHHNCTSCLSVPPPLLFARQSFQALKILKAYLSEIQCAENLLNFIFLN